MLSFFDDNDDSQQQDLDFYGDWIVKQTKIPSKPFEIIEILRAKSGKGYMLYTSDFMVWLWSKSKVCKQLVEALNSYVDFGGVALFIVAKTKKQDGYAIACDKDQSRLWYTNGKKYSLSEIPQESEATEGNPFLLEKSTPAPTTPLESLVSHTHSTDHTVQSTTRKREKKSDKPLSLSQNSSEEFYSEETTA